MKYLFFLSFIIISSCKSEHKIQESKLLNLLNKYKEISFDTLKVFSTNYVEKDSFKFKGIKLDSADVFLLTSEKSKYESFYNEFYGCYKFIIDSNKIGLITRAPGEYESSMIRIYVYDKEKDSIIDNAELADIWGDAGLHFERESYLFWDSDAKLKLFSWIYESEDHSVEDENDSTIEEWNYFHLVSYSNSLHDTINRNAKYLLSRFVKNKSTNNFWIDRYNLKMNPVKDSIGGKPVIFYLNNPKIDQLAKDFYNGKFKPTDNDSTTKLLSLVLTTDEEFRSFYRWCLDKTILISDGALGEYPGDPALKYALNYPEEFLEYMNEDKSGERYIKWKEIISYSGLNNYGDKNTDLIKEAIKSEMIKNCENCSENLKKRIRGFANEIVLEFNNQ